MPSQAAIRAAERITSHLGFYGNKPLEREIAAIIDAEFADVRLALEKALDCLPFNSVGAMKAVGAALAKVRTNG